MSGARKWRFAFLSRRSYRILARNWRDRGGELDVVARDGGTLVFVEVKTRTSDTFALPVDSVGYEKQRKLRRLAERYTMRRDDATAKPGSMSSAS